ncbi:putative RiPP precursor [Croceicoccus sp. F390]|uniref:RiPP n=1 Tax=Croceicoccus esteveae TaxID=3075597 RepID=A0ABU2ZK84_9SPHN|nr:putative RiPP precursor [Croceicoccus sp. F390]MDT0577010.1 putative RiPP precursor [Croceicoccus sp. F390]
MTKATYERPEMTDLGSFESMTQSAVKGSMLDMNEPAGTPVSDLTFS